MITAPGVTPFREFVLFAHNGNRKLDKEGMLVKTTEEGGHREQSITAPSVRGG